MPGNPGVFKPLLRELVPAVITIFPLKNPKLQHFLGGKAGGKAFREILAGRGPKEIYVIRLHPVIDGDA